MAVVIWNNFSWLDLAYGYVHCFTLVIGSKIRSSGFIMQYRIIAILHRGQCSILSVFVLAVGAAVGWAIIVAYIRLTAGLWCATFARFFQLRSPSVIMTTKKVEFVNHKYTPVRSEPPKYLTFSEGLSIHHVCRNKRIYSQTSTRC